MKKEKRLRVTISGSFRKHLDQVVEAITEFSHLDIEILSPRFTVPKNPEDEFVLFEGEETEDPKILEKKHLDAIRSSDFLYLIDPDGYVGKSANLEMGYAISSGRPVFALEEIDDFTLKLFCSGIGSPEEAVRQYRQLNDRMLPRLVGNPGLSEFQDYIHEVVEERRFADESPQDIMLLLVEEIGELAKSLRKHTGLKTDHEHMHRYTPVEGELADCLFYVLDLANGLDIDLEDAFRLKEAGNERRFRQQD